VRFWAISGAYGRALYYAEYRLGIVPNFKQKSTEKTAKKAPFFGHAAIKLGFLGPELVVL